MKISAIACFQNGKVKGTIEFNETENKKVLMKINLEGLPKNSTHGIHIHEAGDLRDNCIAACAHFNPYNKNHGGIHSKERHIGDLGNIIANEYGIVKMQITDNLIKLRNSKCNNFIALISLN